MSANTRKPVCPCCHGEGGFYATQRAPYEDCEVCKGTGHVTKRVMRRERAVERRWQNVPMRGVFAHIITSIDDIPF